MSIPDDISFTPDRTRPLALFALADPLLASGERRESCIQLTCRYCGCALWHAYLALVEVCLAFPANEVIVVCPDCPDALLHDRSRDKNMGTYLAGPPELLEAVRAWFARHRPPS